MDLKSALLAAGFLSLVGYGGLSQLLGNTYALRAPGTFICRNSFCLQQAPAVSYAHVGLSRPLYHCPQHRQEGTKAQDLLAVFQRPSIAGWVVGVVLGVLVPGAIVVAAVRSLFERPSRAAV